MKSGFELLKTKEIIFILDGDVNLGEYEEITIKMPYISGPDICQLSTTLGLAQNYSWSGSKLSRWQYVDNILDYCIKEDKISQLLSYMFSRDKVKDVLKGLSPIDIDVAYENIVGKILEQINIILFFGGNELAIVNRQYIIRKIGETVKIEAPAIKVIDRDYIKNLSERALNDIVENNYDSAITKARTILEETFCYVIEKKNIEPTDNGDIGKLYGQVKELYNMHADKSMDKRINMLLSGLEKIVSAIAEIRNKDSDAHGVGNKRINILDYHARLFVNASVLMGDFILSIYQNSDKSK